MGICSYKIILDYFLPSSNISISKFEFLFKCHYAYKNRSFYDVWEYAVTELFMITFFLHPVFPFLRLSSHLSGDALEVDSQSLHYLWDLQLS